MRESRLYGLFAVATVNGRKKYTRKYPLLAYSKSKAVRVFQNSLLDGASSGNICELRPLSRQEIANIEAEFVRQEAI